MLLKEKKDYIYKNYRNATGKCILFPGCNFPSFYPKTMKKLVKLLKEHGIGVAYDCCGKPIAELGLEAALDCGLCLGEGTGALLYLPALLMAEEVYRSMSTFSENQIEEYQELT